jgi:hypothetical protein
MEVGTNYIDQRAKDYLTQEPKQLNNNKNDCIKHFCIDRAHCIHSASLNTTAQTDNRGIQVGGLTVSEVT